jgi:Rha family phage regulatory protein
MSNLTIINQDGKFLVDSRQVAEMVDKEHKNILADIRGYKSILENSGELNFQPTDFFIESTYMSDQNKILPCFLITRKGCDMVANKMTGEKGVLFTAAYVTKFEEMEKQGVKRLRRINQQSRVKPAVKDAFDAADFLTERLGIKPGIAQAACLRAVEKNCGLDLTEIAKCLPPAEHDTGFLNPTEIGKRIGLSAVKTNQLLATKSMQVRIDDEWRLTDAGKQYGEEMPYVKNGHSGYQIRWNEKVVDVLKDLAS